MDFSEKEALLTLNAISDCHVNKIKPLVEVVGSVEGLFTSANLNLLKKTSVLGRRFVKSIENVLTKFDPQKELQKIASGNYVFCSFLDEEYPKDLLEIHDPPIGLYVCGESNISFPAMIGIVGSRRASLYGQAMAEELAYNFALAGITVVSGMARGIDSAAHQGALKVGGYTLAVLGSGVDVIYPAAHRNLYYAIAEHGAVVSEYPIGMPPLAENFPRRNRIISGLVKGVIVVEAALRSGSLITARLAIEEGRDVFAVPGKADSISSQGTNNLIKEGASLITNANEIIERLFPDLSVKRVPLKKHNKKVLNSRGSLSSQEEKIYSLLGSDPLHVDTLIGKSDMDPKDILSLLTHLELKKSIKKVFGGGYVRA